MKIKWQDTGKDENGLPQIHNCVEYRATKGGTEYRLFVQFAQDRKGRRWSMWTVHNSYLQGVRDVRYRTNKERRKLKRLAKKWATEQLKTDLEKIAEASK